MVAELDLVLRAVGISPNKDPLVLVGYSYGTVVARGLAAMRSSNAAAAATTTTAATSRRMRRTWQVSSIIAIDGTHESSVPTPQCAASAAAVAVALSQNRRWLLELFWKARLPQTLSRIVPLPTIPRESPLVIPTPCVSCGRRGDEQLNDPTPRKVLGGAGSSNGYSGGDSSGAGSAGVDAGGGARAGLGAGSGGAIHATNGSGALYASTGGDAAGHACLFQYYTGLLLAAVRCGKFKLRFDLEPVELYDLDADIGEQHPLPNTTAMWQSVVLNITAARDAHLKTVVKVQDQLALGSNNKYALCGAPDSKTRYPQYPNCTMNPENWITPW